LRLLDPILLLDAPFETEGLADARDIRRFPSTNLGKRAHIELVQCRLDVGVDLPDALQVVGSASGACRARGDPRTQCCRAVACDRTGRPGQCAFEAIDQAG